MRYEIDNLDSYPIQTLLDKGAYRVAISKMEPKETKSGGMMIAVELDVGDGPEQVNGSSCLGRKLFYNLILPSRTHKDGGIAAGGRVRQFCKAFGIPYDPRGFDDEDAIGKEAIAILGYREYDGEEQHEIKRFKEIN